jgi:predicted cupin superfamily sugar epimerase
VAGVGSVAGVEAQEVIRALGLAAHPEGGWFRETWREPAGTAIYYLLAEGEESRRHRLDKTEIWHFYAGDPLELTVGGEPVVLGPDVAAGQRPQVVAPARAWQSARPLGAWTLAGCTVSPAFDYAGFELA